MEWLLCPLLLVLLLLLLPMLLLMLLLPTTARDQLLCPELAAITE